MQIYEIKMTFHILDCFDDNIDNLDITKNYIYVLQLISERYYVGRTANILTRIEQHFTGRGAKYTKKYKPLKVIQVIRELSKDDERNKTIEIMKKYGWEKVRGSCWCSIEISKPNYIDNNICWLDNKKIDIINKNINVESSNAEMESPMLKMLKSKNPNANYPFNMGQKWSDEEERILLDELNKNTDIEIIAKDHDRTVGGINARRREIAYKLFENNTSIEEIINKTKLTRSEILDTIQRRKNSKKSKNSKNSKSELKQDIPKNINNDMEIKSEMTKMRNEISELKKTIKELVEMMNAVYEFEDS